MADCFRSCGRPSNGTINDQPTTCPSPATTAHCLYCLLSEGLSGTWMRLDHWPVPPFQRFGDTPSLLGWTILRSPDWSTVVGSISRQTLRRPRRTAMTPIALLSSLLP
ncbi:hypothetical protein K523DRAFT_370221 [Schizophyllum commune Tattone D]|nr:hypothetical protein K523DRAFT_370221 [Schizophyllum commune Tattone D]